MKIMSESFAKGPAASKSAEGGASISAEDILVSLVPLMKEYFAGRAAFNGRYIEYIFGGRKFCISVTACY